MELAQQGLGAIAVAPGDGIPELLVAAVRAIGHSMNGCQPGRLRRIAISASRMTRTNATLSVSSTSSWSKNAWRSRP